MSAEGRSRPSEPRRRPAAVRPIPDLHASMAAVRYAAATRSNRRNAGSRPTSDVAPCAPLRSLVLAAGVDKSSPSAAITLPGADAVISDEDLLLDPFEPLIRRRRPHRTRPFIPRFRNYCRDSQGHPSTARNVIWPNPGDNARRSATFPRGEFEPHITLGLV